MPVEFGIENMINALNVAVNIVASCLFRVMKFTREDRQIYIARIADNRLMEHL